MEIKKKCSKCETELIIQVSSLLFAEEKKAETAHCPVCDSEVYKGETDGWYFVQTAENFKKNPKIACIYPMA